MWLDLEAWPRRAHHDYFRRYDSPFWGVCAPVDVTATHAWCKAHEASFFLAGWYAALGAVNAVEALRMRLRGDRVWVHPRVGLGSTVLGPDETFRFAYLEPHLSWPEFAASAAESVAEAVDGPPRLEDAPDRDDVVFGTVVPWIAFTAISHARRASADDSVPRLAFGKFEKREGRLMMPAGIDAHHALVDGLHVGRFYEGLAARLADPEGTFGSRGNV